MKKVTTILIALISLTATAQDLDMNEVDEFTGASKKVTKEYVCAEGVTKIAMRFGNIDGTHCIYTYPYKKLGCSGAVGNYLILKFTDGTTIKLEDVSDIDCKDYATSIFIFQPELVKGKVIEKIRFKQSEYYDDGEWISEFNLADFVNAVK